MTEPGRVSPSDQLVAVTFTPKEAELVRRAVEHYKDGLERAYVEASVQNAGSLNWNTLASICIDISWRITEAQRG